MNAPAPILSSMKKDGSRIMIHTADVRGKWIKRRQWVYAALIAFFIASPLIPMGGHSMLMFDVDRRSFYLFGGTFNAQDFWMVLLIVLSFVFGLLVVTAWRGRLWCGWACPQILFIEGPRERRIKLKSEPWTTEKILRRAGKLTAFLIVTLLITHTFAAVLVSPRELWLMLKEGPFEHQQAFFLTNFVTAALMFNFTWFREQFCVVVCPWGRAQSVLLDKDTLVVSYDAARGEPRGKVVKDPPAGAKLGDCVDCKRCIHVCPTGIDIREGVQLECLACAQCVDACDEVMEKLNRPQGLISMGASVNERQGLPRRVLRPRLFLNAFLMTAAMVTLTVALTTRTPFEANVFRARGANPFLLDGDEVRMPFQIHVFNKNTQTAKFHVKVISPVPADVVLGQEDFELGSLTDTFVPVTVSIDRKDLTQPVDIGLVVRDENRAPRRSSRFGS